MELRATGLQLPYGITQFYLQKNPILNCYRNRPGLLLGDILIDIAVGYVREVEVGTWNNRITYGRQVLYFQITETSGTRSLHYDTHDMCC